MRLRCHTLPGSTEELSGARVVVIYAARAERETCPCIGNGARMSVRAMGNGALMSVRAMARFTTEGETT
jgi:hypothetical protein